MLDLETTEATVASLKFVSASLNWLLMSANPTDGAAIGDDAVEMNEEDVPDPGDAKSVSTSAASSRSVEPPIDTDVDDGHPQDPTHPPPTAPLVSVNAAMQTSSPSSLSQQRQSRTDNNESKSTAESAAEVRPQRNALTASTSNKTSTPSAGVIIETEGDDRVEPMDTSEGHLSTGDLDEASVSVGELDTTEANVSLGNVTSPSEQNVAATSMEGDEERDDDNSLSPDATDQNQNSAVGDDNDDPTALTVSEIANAFNCTNECIILLNLEK